MGKDKIVNINSARGKTNVEQILKRALEFNDKGNIVRALIVFQFKNKEDEECMGLYVGINGNEDYTTSLAAWDLEHARLGLFDGEYEAGMGENG